MKIVFITGGVMSSLGKGVTSASLGMLLKSRGYRVTMMKFDPYLNVDPGTMNPFQHGEVFVTDNGGETDLDLGHYERFIDSSLSKRSSITSGKLYSSLIERERRGDFNGGTRTGGASFDKRHQAGHQGCGNQGQCRCNAGRGWRHGRRY